MRRKAILSISLVMFGFSVSAFADPGYDAYSTGDYQTALKYWKPLAEKDDAYSQLNIGVLYSNGEGVAQDNAKAIYWYRRAAENGDLEAQLVLGDIYRDGEITEKDNAEAAKWYDMAAKQGHSGAKYQFNQLSSDPCIRLSPNDNYAEGFKSTIFANTVTQHDVNKVKAMLACGADINSADADGYLPIHLAATSSTSEIVELLLANGAKVNERNAATGESPLHLAVTYNKDLAVVKTLLEHGADKNQTNAAGLTPIQSTEDPGITALLR